MFFSIFFVFASHHQLFLLDHQSLCQALLPENLPNAEFLFQNKTIKSFVILCHIWPHVYRLESLHFRTNFSQFRPCSPPSFVAIGYPCYQWPRCSPKVTQRAQFWGQYFQHSSQVKPMPLGLSCSRSSVPFTSLGGSFKNYIHLHFLQVVPPMCSPLHVLSHS